MSLTIGNLINCFDTAKEHNARYIGILIAMKDFPKPEIIVNSKENFDSKLEYYKETYDENLIHKHARNISIIGFTYGDTFDDIEEDLI